ncbi:MAG: hypothetical protein ABJN22_09955 [Litorimonas sp.]
MRTLRNILRRAYFRRAEIEKASKRKGSVVLEFFGHSNAFLFTNLSCRWRLRRREDLKNFHDPKAGKTTNIKIIPIRIPNPVESKLPEVGMSIEATIMTKPKNAAHIPRDTVPTVSHAIFWSWVMKKYPPMMVLG